MGTVILSLLVVLSGPATVADDPGFSASCGQDHYEPNDRVDDARSADAKQVSGRICQGDEDWFQLKARQGDRIRIQMQHPVNGRIVSEVFSARSGLSMETTVLKTETGTEFEVVADSTGPFRFRLSTSNPASLRYSLRVVIDQPVKAELPKVDAVPKAVLDFLRD